VVKAEGTQGSYDWMAENILDAAGRSREIIPDGKLCSANKPEFAGLDLGRSDWPTTSMAAGSKVTIKFIATAPHLGTFSLYMTKNGYDPSKPLVWSDLQSKPFLQATNPRLVNGVYQMPATLPGGSVGRNLIYTIWQRSDSAEAFYSCSDVMLTGKSTGSPRDESTTPPAVAPTSAGSMPGMVGSSSDAGAHGNGRPSPAVAGGDVSAGGALSGGGGSSGGGLSGSGGSSVGALSGGRSSAGGLSGSDGSSVGGLSAGGPAPKVVAGSGGLPLTGEDAIGIALTAFLVIVVGAMLILASRRRGLHSR
jgi:chitin-binding protein